MDLTAGRAAFAEMVRSGTRDRRLADPRRAWLCSRPATARHAGEAVEIAEITGGTASERAKAAASASSASARSGRPSARLAGERHRAITSPTQRESRGRWRTRSVQAYRTLQMMRRAKSTWSAYAPPPVAHAELAEQRSPPSRHHLREGPSRTRRHRRADRADWCASGRAADSRFCSASSANRGDAADDAVRLIGTPMTFRNRFAGLRRCRDDLVLQSCVWAAGDVGHSVHCGRPLRY